MNKTQKTQKTQIKADVIRKARQDVEVDVREVEWGAIAEARRLAHDTAVGAVLAALRTAQASSEGWDWSARDAQSHGHAGVPEPLAETYYTEYQRHGAEYAAERIADLELRVEAEAASEVQS